MKKYDDELDFDEALLKEKTPGKKQLIFSVCGIAIFVAILLNFSGILSGQSLASNF